MYMRGGEREREREGGLTTRKSSVELHQTVLQLPPLTSFRLPPQHCYIVTFCFVSYCPCDIVPRPQLLLETLRLFVIMWAYTQHLPYTEFNSQSANFHEFHIITLCFYV